jgi:hypothetical protein
VGVDKRWKTESELGSAFIDLTEWYRASCFPIYFLHAPAYAAETINKT